MLCLAVVTHPGAMQNAFRQAGVHVPDGLKSFLSKPAENAVALRDFVVSEILASSNLKKREAHEMQVQQTPIADMYFDLDANSDGEEKKEEVGEDLRVTLKEKLESFGKLKLTKKRFGATKEIKHQNFQVAYDEVVALWKACGDGAEEVITGKGMRKLGKARRREIEALDA